VLTCELNGITFINTYVPNGNTVGSDKWEYKLRWLDRFSRMLSERYRPDQPVVWLGDINIAPTPDDVFDSPKMLGKVGHHPDEFSRLEGIRQWGLIDLFRLHHSGPGDYTFWDFVIPRSVERNLGWRIDHIYGTQPIADACRAILDGHIILSRKLAAAGHYPAIDVMHSVSRLCSQLSKPQQLAATRKLREAMSTYDESKDLIDLGAYTPGTNAALDAAVRMQPEITDFLRQDTTVDAPLAEGLDRLQSIAGRL